MLINFCINHKNFENWQIPNFFETNPFCFAAATPRAVGAAVQTVGQEPRGGTSQRGAAGPGAVPTSAMLKLWVFNKKTFQCVARAEPRWFPRRFLCLVQQHCRHMQVAPHLHSSLPAHSSPARGSCRQCPALPPPCGAAGCGGMVGR